MTEAGAPLRNRPPQTISESGPDSIRGRATDQPRPASEWLPRGAAIHVFIRQGPFEVAEQSHQGGEIRQVFHGLATETQSCGIPRQVVRVQPTVGQYAMDFLLPPQRPAATHDWRRELSKTSPWTTGDVPKPMQLDDVPAGATAVDPGVANERIRNCTRILANPPSETRPCALTCMRTIRSLLNVSRSSVTRNSAVSGRFLQRRHAAPTQLQGRNALLRPGRPRSANSRPLGGAIGTTWLEENGSTLHRNSAARSPQQSEDGAAQHRARLLMHLRGEIGSRRLLSFVTEEP